MPRERKGASILTNQNDYVAFDLETTGLDPRWDDIIEIGAVKVRNGQPADRYEQLINPGRPIPSVITEITGIDDDMVKDAPALADVLPGFLEWVGDGILLGHNVNFDINFLYDSAEELCEEPVDNDFIDTLRLARYLYPEERHNRLRDLISRFGIADAPTVAESKPSPKGKGAMWNPAEEMANGKPAGTEIEARLNAEVLHSTDRQDKLSEYGRDTWVWVSLEKTTIPQGEGKGQPTVSISLDGDPIGWLSKRRAEQHLPQIPDGTVAAKAFIKHRKTGLTLLVYLPWDE